MYAFAFISRSSAIALPVGIAGRLQEVGKGKVVAIAEPHLELEMLQSSDDRLLQAVLQHDRVVRDLFLQTTVLPLRFGTLFVSEAGLVDHLQSQEGVYLQQLERLKGQAEYTLKLVPTAHEATLEAENCGEKRSPAEMGGRDYFLAKKQRLLDQQALQQQQQQQLQRLKREVEQYLQTHLNGALSGPILAQPQDGIERLYLLFPRPIESLLMAALEQWQAICPDWQLSLGEGLPPYHFV